MSCNNNEYRHIYQRFFALYLKKHLLLYIFCTVISAVGLFLVFSSIGVLMRQILSMVTGDMPQDAFEHALMFLGIILFLSVLSGLSGIGFAYIEQQIQMEIRTMMVESYIFGIEQRTRDYTENDILSRMNQDLPKYTRLFGKYMSGWIYEPILCGIFSLTLLAFIDLRLMVLCLLCALLNVGCTKLYAKKRALLNEKIAEGKSSSYNLMRECIDGGIEVRTFKLHDKIIEKLLSILQTINNAVGKMNTSLFIRNCLIHYMSDFFVILLILLLGAYLSEKNYVSFADVMLAIPLSDQINQMIVALWHKEVIKKESFPFGKRIVSVYSEASDTDHVHYESNTEYGLKAVHINYGYNEATILDNVTCQFPRNKKTAIVGESGCGKTTLLKILSGLEKADNGFVCAHISDRISYMPQKSKLLNTSIAKNIALSNKTDIERVRACAERAYADDFIKEKDNSYNYEVIGDDQDFSGGQIQRIALARTLYQNNSVLLFDEPTASLDKESSDYIRRTLEAINDKTVIVVTHRLDLIKNFDVIIVMDSGRIQAIGTHQELMQNCMTYQKLYENK